MVSWETSTHVPRPKRHCNARATVDLPDAELPRITMRVLIPRNFLRPVHGLGAVDWEVLGEQLVARSRVCARRFGIDRTAEWFPMKVAEEAGELMQQCSWPIVVAPTFKR